MLRTRKLLKDVASPKQARKARYRSDVVPPRLKPCSQSRDDFIFVSDGDSIFAQGLLTLFTMNIFTTFPYSLPTLGVQPMTFA